MQNKKNIIYTLALILSIITIYSYLKTPEYYSTSITDLDLVADTINSEYPINQPHTFNLYLENKHPYKIHIESPSIINYYRAHFGHMGSIVSAIQTLDNGNETLIFESCQRLFLATITLQEIMEPGFYEIHVGYGPLEINKKIVYVNTFDNVVEDNYNSSTLEYRNRMLKRDVLVYLDKYVYENTDLINLTVKNNGETFVNTGVYQLIQSYEAGKWVNRTWSPDDVWILIEIPINQGEEYGFTIDPSNLETGFYRVVKEITFGSQEILAYYTEFRIN